MVVPALPAVLASGHGDAAVGVDGHSLADAIGARHGALPGCAGNGRIQAAHVARVDGTDLAKVCALATNVQAL